MGSLFITRTYSADCPCTLSAFHSWKPCLKRMVTKGPGQGIWQSLARRSGRFPSQFEGAGKCLYTFASFSLLHFRGFKNRPKFGNAVTLIGLFYSLRRFCAYFFVPHTKCRRARGIPTGIRELSIIISLYLLGQKEANSLGAVGFCRSWVHVKSQMCNSNSYHTIFSCECV